jgi:hypothetical protein
VELRGRSDVAEASRHWFFADSGHLIEYYLEIEVPDGCLTWALVVTQAGGSGPWNVRSHETSPNIRKSSTRFLARHMTPRASLVAYLRRFANCSHANTSRRSPHAATPTRQRSGTAVWARGVDQSPHAPGAENDITVAFRARGRQVARSP